MAGGPGLRQCPAACLRPGRSGDPAIRRSGDPAQIWEIVTGDLPLMAEAAEAALLQLDKAQKS
jgi:hypothetical protein